MKRFSALLLTTLIALPACKGMTKDSTNYPIDPEHVRAYRHGRVTGDDGFTLFGGKDSKKGGGGNVSGLAVNAYLWQATLDTLAFMPLASTDPFGGVIITDWYEPPENPGERFKLHTVIRDQALRSDSIQVSAFRQKMDAKGNWRDQAASDSLKREFEEIILTRARELKVKAQQ